MAIHGEDGDDDEYEYDAHAYGEDDDDYKVDYDHSSDAENYDADTTDKEDYERRLGVEWSSVRGRGGEGGLWRQKWLKIITPDNPFLMTR